VTATGSRGAVARLAGATLAALAALALTPVAAAQGRFEWRDVRQHVTIESDGGVVIVDERTLWTNQDFGEAFVCVRLERGQRLTMLPETGAVSPGPPAEGRTQACDGGTEVFVRQASRVSERRVRFAYRLEGTVEAHRDVVEWYWNVLERDRPVVLGYQLEVVAPGPMTHPFDAYVMRYANPEEPRVSLSGDRSVLRVAFDRVPAGDGVEIRWFMDPELFTMPSSGRDAFEGLLRDQMRVAGVQERERLAQAVRSHPAFGLLPAVAVLWLLVAIVGAYRRVGREPVVDAMRYPFEPPSELPPAIVTTLLHQQPNPSSMGPAWFATIMDLARRGFLRFEGEGRGMAIHLTADTDTGPLEGFERSVLTYLERAAQSGRSGRRDAQSVTLSELTTYGRSNAQRFLSSFGAAIIAWGKGYFGGPYTTDESRAARNRWAGRGFLVALGCGLLAWALLDVARVLAIVGAALAVVLVLVAAAALPAWRPELAKERAGWIGFRRTLTSYTRMRDAPPDFFRLWDRYYVYAAALGVAERYLRTLARAAPRAGVDQAAMTRQGAWLGATRASDLGQVARSVSRMSSALSQAGASASSGGSSSGGGGGGGGGSSGGR
jgi:uncharacterized membrane protein YgcG